MPLINCEPVVVVTDSAHEKAHASLGLVCELGQVFEASGSASVVDDGAEALCSVYGPRTTAKSQSSMDCAVLECEVHYAPLLKPPTFSSVLQFGTLSSGKADSTAACAHSDAFVENLIRDNLHGALLGMVRLQCYPKMRIAVHVVLLRSSGNIGQDLSASIMAASLALADASVETLDLLAASTVGFPLSGQEGVENPRCSGRVTVCSRLHAAEVPQLWTEGRLTAQEAFSLVEHGCCLNMSKKVQLEEQLLRKIAKSVQ